MMPTALHLRAAGTARQLRQVLPIVLPDPAREPAIGVDRVRCRRQGILGRRTGGDAPQQIEDVDNRLLSLRTELAMKLVADEWGTASIRIQSPLRMTPPPAATITARSNCATFVPSTVRASQRFAM